MEEGSFLDLHHFGDRSVLHHGGDAVVAVALGGVHLALTDDLAVGGLQVEVRLAVLGHKLVETFLLDSMYSAAGRNTAVHS